MMTIGEKRHSGSNSEHHKPAIRLTMASSSSSSSPKDPLDQLVYDARFLVKPVFPSTEEIQLGLDREVQDCAETFYRVGRKSILPANRSATTPQDFVLARFAALNRNTDAEISQCRATAEQTAFRRFTEITRKYRLGGLMGPPATISNEERYVFETLSPRPAEYLKRTDIVSFITARCLAGDVKFFIRFGRKLKKLNDRNFDPFHEIDYALPRYWTHPLMPLWMMTDDAGSTALSAAIRKTVQKETYTKVRKRLGLPRFLKHAIREVKIFKNRELEYVYFDWLTTERKKRKT